ncbi:hypothetical protein NEOLEDRAFT_1184020 [Neolentinus lepideus HHB14362 ss-1]|uniref:Uncharacterized protein n=1 Tax=Neolentinus lepideus HHB14362 ss-1 TaxID=1314782 RepID=A0A165MTF4_9AGAM|nr:hypothetical protein NEOLEDRAFT_1184020 [Neolentinus lepideus HHB14362 ss-1]
MKSSLADYGSDSGRASEGEDSGDEETARLRNQMHQEMRRAASSQKMLRIGAPILPQTCFNVESALERVEQQCLNRDLADEYFSDDKDELELDDMQQPSPVCHDNIDGTVESIEQHCLNRDLADVYVSGDEDELELNDMQEPSPVCHDDVDATTSESSVLSMPAGTEKVETRVKRRKKIWCRKRRAREQAALHTNQKLSSLRHLQADTVLQTSVTLDELHTNTSAYQGPWHPVGVDEKMEYG